MTHHISSLDSPYLIHSIWGSWFEVLPVTFFPSSILSRFHLQLYCHWMTQVNIQPLDGPTSFSSLWSIIYYCSPRKPVQHGMGRRHSRPRRNRWGFAHGRHSLRQVIRYLEELANPGKAGCPGQRGPGCQSAKNTKIRKYSTTWSRKDHTQLTHKITRIQETV